MGESKANLKATSTILFLIGFGVLGVCASLYTDPYRSQGDDTLYLSSLEHGYSTFRFQASQSVMGDFVASLENQVTLTIKDPAGNELYSSDGSNSGTFEFRTGAEGYYKFHFTNLQNNLTTVTLTVKQDNSSETAFRLLLLGISCLMSGSLALYQHNRQLKVTRF